MITLSKKTLDLIKAETAKPHIHAAVADGSLSSGHFSAELNSALADDAKVDGTGAFMVPQIVNLVSQLMSVNLGPVIPVVPGQPLPPIGHIPPGTPTPPGASVSVTPQK